MTPPVYGKPGNPGTSLVPASYPDSATDVSPANRPAVVIGEGSSYVRLDSGTDPFSSVEEMLKAMGDEQLFGSVANAKYQSERNGKYLKVTLAIMEMKKYLRGDEKNAALAPKKIEDWLNDADLLGDTVVAHQARVNLIKVLKRAPKDQGIAEGVKAMLEALTKNYAPKAAAAKPAEAPAETKPKDVATLLADLADAKLFGDKFSSYDAKRNKEYLAVSLALIEIRKFVRVDSVEADTASTKISAWLNDYALLTDQVPHQARVNLIKALEGASGGSEDWKKGIQKIVGALKATYSPTAPEKPAPPDPPKDVPKDKPKDPPKTEEKPKEDPPVDKPKEAEKPKEETKPKVLQSKYVFTKFTYAMKDKREDTDMTLVKTVMATLRPAVDPLIAKDPAFAMQASMRVKINNETGEVVEIVFEDVKVQGKTATEEVESAIQNMAERFHARYRFVRSNDFKGPSTVIEIPLDFKKK
ncbi:MAG: hypothetical protein K8R69_10555 [Deltaproteobacteria bacterium]|nr:hypothetical protein [Deltaproteobacteria bacterium]